MEKAKLPWPRPLDPNNLIEQEHLNKINKLPGYGAPGQIPQAQPLDEIVARTERDIAEFAKANVARDPIKELCQSLSKFTYRQMMDYAKALEGHLPAGEGNKPTVEQLAAALQTTAESWGKVKVNIDPVNE